MICVHLCMYVCMHVYGHKSEHQQCISRHVVRAWMYVSSSWYLCSSVLHVNACVCAYMYSFARQCGNMAGIKYFLRCVCEHLVTSVVCAHLVAHTRVCRIPPMIGFHKSNYVYMCAYMHVHVHVCVHIPPFQHVHIRGVVRSRRKYN